MQTIKKALVVANRNLKRLSDGGVTIAMGTDGGAAKVMRRNEAGTIQAGRRADLLVLNADPLADIRNTRQIDSVWVAGRRLGDAN